MDKVVYQADFKENEPLKGIFYHMTKENNKNPVDSGLISIKVPTQIDPFNNPKNIFDVSPKGINNCLYNYFCGFPKANQNWFSIDFGKNKRVSITGYTIRNSDRYLAKSWEILGSNDQKEWFPIHSVINANENKKQKTEFWFSCSSPSQLFRYVKFAQNSNYDRNPDCRFIIQLSVFELFGTVYTN